MKLLRREFLHLAAGAGALPVASRIARAETYPSRPVRLIVGFPAGGLTDILARLLSPWLSERLGQQFIVEDQPGAGTNLATERVVRALPDGYTFLMATSTNAINATLYDNLKFNFIGDTAPVASIALTPLVMVVHPSFPANTVSDFMTYAKANPGKINMATAGIGRFGPSRRRVVHDDDRGPVGPSALSHQLRARYARRTGASGVQSHTDDDPAGQSG